MKKMAEKIFVMGIDGMDPRLTVKFVNQGLMPNTKKLIEQGAQRQDLVMLGGHPTVTPPMWTTLATGAYPITHGITAFSRRSKEDLDVTEYNLDSRNCKAEPLWNVFVEAGLKTLVFHWPGSSWPPTSDNPNLHVIDGTQPPTVNMGVALMEHEIILVASERTEEVHYREKATTDTNVPCVITDLQPSSEIFNAMSVGTKPMSRLILSENETQGTLSDTPFDVVLSPIKPARGWSKALPDGAKEFTLLFSKGLLRRVGLILKNEQGIYNRVELYKNKKETTPIVGLANNVFTTEIIDDCIKDDVHYTVNRNMRILEIGADGNYLKIWISGAMDINNDSVWHPKRLYQEVVKYAGYPSPEVMLGGKDKILIRDCMAANWDVVADWQAKAINHLIEVENYSFVFSHFHNIDAQGHMIMKFLKGNEKITAEEYQTILEECYVQTDRYIGQFMHLLAKDWTIFVVSDHAQVCPEFNPPMLCDGSGVDVRVMEELGFTAIKEDEATHEMVLDWDKTRAIANGMNIYINLKGRDKHGIVDPADKYVLEEDIITALYGYKDKHTGKRIVSLALRNRDAIILGLGGDECGDIIITLAEGYNFDHADSLSTTLGCADTSVSPIFIAAGKGLKKHFTTERIIREVDLTPTMAVLAGVRMPAQCEGAPIYQILECNN